MGEYSKNSGYTPGLVQGTTVCGCADWESMGIDAPPKFPCIVSDPMWEDKSLPFLKFIKKGCSNAYVWAFDDSSSLFTSESQEYTIEFCPEDSEANLFGIIVKH